MAYFRTEGIVLKRINLGEADRIITFFTKNHGKIKAVAKGVRRITSKKAAHLEVFTHASLFLAKGKNLDILTEAQTITQFHYFRTSLPHAAYAFWLIEETERICGEAERMPKIFNLLLTTLTQLSTTKTDIKALNDVRDQFSLTLLWELGFLPKERKLFGERLDRYFESVIERTIKSKSLISLKT